MRFVDDLLRTKGRDVWSVVPDATVFEALQMMADKNIGALVVLEGERLVGILSERDYARKLALEGKRSFETSVRDTMTEIVATVTESCSVKECMKVMTNERVRHLPVMEGDRLVGMISIGDVVKSIMDEQETTIQQLENYIQGNV